MPKLRNSSALSPAIDSLIALGLAATAVVWANHRYLGEGGFIAFLWARITLLNCSFAVVFLISWKQCMTYLGLYGSKLDGLRKLVGRVMAGCAIMTSLLAFFLNARKTQEPIGQILLLYFGLAFIYEMARTVVASRRLNWQMIEPEWVLVIGSGRGASKAWRELRVHHRTKRLLGFIDDRHVDEMAPDVASRLVGTIDELPAYLLRNVVDEIILAAPMRSCYDLNQRAVSIAEAAGVRVLFLNDMFTVTHEKRARRRAPLFLELVKKDQRREMAEAAKRFVDVFAAATGLLVLSPVFFAIGMAIKLTSAGPMLAIEERQGYGRRPFRMFRFRSIAGDTRDLTAVGGFLRRTLLDELPELWNVLLGDMSLVGPRPMKMEDIALFSEPQLLRRFSVRPGVIANWQIADFLPTSFEQAVARDISYIDRWSLTEDMKILARTVPAAIRRASAGL